jgi:branched-chain amino acid transport system permease protein
MKRTNLVIFGVIVIVVALCPLFMKVITLRLATEVLYYCLFAVSLNLITGYGGLLSFGHAAYFGVGAYMTALSLVHIKGLGLISAILIGGLSAALIGAFFSIFLIRVSGTYYAMLTLAFNQLLYAVALKWRSVTGGDDGLGGFPKPNLHLPFLGQINMADTANFFWFTMVVVGLMLLLAWHLTRTSLGVSIVLLRENEERAKFLGHRTAITRFWLFTFSAFLAGIAGSMFALFQEFVSTGAIDIFKAIDVILMTVIGGVSSFFGPMLGAAFMVFVGDWLSGITAQWEFYIGVFFIAMVLFFRGGLISIGPLAWQWARARIKRTEQVTGS